MEGVKFQNILQKNADGSYAGAMSPVLFAKEMAELCSMRVHSIVRIRFPDERMHQSIDDLNRGTLTGHDTLVLIEKYQDGNMQLAMFVDEGGSGCPVGMMFLDELEPIVTPIYIRRNYELKLSDEQLKVILMSIAVMELEMLTENN